MGERLDVHHRVAPHLREDGGAAMAWLFASPSMRLRRAARQDQASMPSTTKPEESIPRASMARRMGGARHAMLKRPPPSRSHPRPWPRFREDPLERLLALRGGHHLGVAHARDPGPGPKDDAGGHDRAGQRPRPPRRPRQEVAQRTR